MNLKDRIKRRLVIERVAAVDAETGQVPGVGTHSASIFVQLEDAALVAALEAEDSANPIAATAVVRQPLALTLDEDAFRQATS